MCFSETRISKYEFRNKFKLAKLENDQDEKARFEFVLFEHLVLVSEFGLRVSSFGRALSGAFLGLTFGCSRRRGDFLRRRIRFWRFEFFFQRAPDVWPLFIKNAEQDRISLPSIFQDKIMAENSLLLRSKANEGLARLLVHFVRSKLDPDAVEPFKGEAK